MIRIKRLGASLMVAVMVAMMSVSMVPTQTAQAHSYYFWRGYCQYHLHHYTTWWHWTHSHGCQYAAARYR